MTIISYFKKIASPCDAEHEGSEKPLVLETYLMIINHKAVPAKKQVYTELYTVLYTKSVVKTGKEYKDFNKKP